MNKNRLYNGYYLSDWDGWGNKDACERCELTKECDRLADELNDISYCMCQSLGVIKDINYKKEHPYAYFKKISSNVENN